MLGARRWAFLGSVAFVLVLVGWTLHHGGLLVLAMPFVCYLALGFYFSLPAIQLNARRTLSQTRALSEECIQVSTLIQNTGPGLELIEFEDKVPNSVRVSEGEPRRIDTLGPGQNTVLRYTVNGVRGLARWQSVQITVTDTLGLYLKRWDLSCENELLVVPTFERLDEILIRPRQTHIFSGQVNAHRGGAGIEFFGVREYSPGDERRHLNWKATARRDWPMINEFEQERVADVIILLDARERSDVIVKGMSLFEHSVRAALALAHYFSAQGNRVGLLIYGNHKFFTRVKAWYPSLQN
jgi:uncharacterized protein (DUF58 family)